MPELPDLTVVAEAFHAALAGRSVVHAEAPGPLAVRGTPAELDALAGQRIERVRRRGKFLILDLERDAIVVNPMLTGRFQLAPPGAARPSKTAFVLRFGPRDGGPPRDAAKWTRGAPWLLPDDVHAEIRYRDPTQMGKVYLLPAGVAREIPGGGPDDFGPEADDPALTLDVWRERIRRHPGELKNLLKNQSFVAGIGNAYSDEILHAARLLPLRKRSSLAPEEVDELYRRDAPGPRGCGGRASRARAAHVREAGARLPRRAQQGRHALPAVRDANHRDQARRIHHLVLPRLPEVAGRDRVPGRRCAGERRVATGASGPGRPSRSRGSLIWLSSWRILTVVPKRAAISERVSPFFTL